MNYKQRKQHRLVWLILAVLLPALFLLAVLSIPDTAVQEEWFLTQ